MNATTYSAIAAFAAAISAALTLFIAWANYQSARTGVSSADFTSCLEVVTKLADAQRRVLAAKETVAKDFEFRELLNLMEALALLENERRLAAATRKVTSHFLIETYAFLRSQPQLGQLLIDSVTSAETFIELTRFAERHKANIESLTFRYERESSADG